MALAEPADLEGAARGIAFRLSENLGLLPRAAVADEVKGLDQDVRGKMRKLGVKFGAYHIYVPLSLKPAPRELALILFALKNGGVRQPGVSRPAAYRALGPHLVPDRSRGRPRKLYEVAGFKVAGKRAVRVDILERLADIIRPLIALDAEDPPGRAARRRRRRQRLPRHGRDDLAARLRRRGFRLDPHLARLSRPPHAEGRSAGRQRRLQHPAIGRRQPRPTPPRTAASRVHASR